MKHSSLSVRNLAVFCSLAASVVGAWAAQPVTTPAAKAKEPTTTVDLPRLKQQGKAGAVAPIARNKVTIDDLKVTSAADSKTAALGTKNYLTVDGGKSVARPIRGLANETTFVSFFVYASVGTTVDVGGAKVTVAPGIKPGVVQLRLGTGADAASHEIANTIKLERHGTADLAPLPVLTARLDPQAGTWDLFMFERLIAADLPLGSESRDRSFKLSAGTGGAWLLSLVSSDENPLFEDANANGVEDAFERKKNGALLTATASSSARRTLVESFQGAQRTTSFKSWNVRRPLPTKS